MSMLKAREFYRKNISWIWLAILAGLVFVILLIPTLIWPAFFRNVFTNPEEIQRLVLSYPGLTAIAFISVSIVTILIPIVPNDIVPIVGGIIFGFWEALCLSIIARIIGSSLNYGLGRGIRESFYMKLVSGDDQSKLKKYTEKMGWPLVFVSRFLPSADTDIIAYVAGIARMDYFKFILASFFGMLVPVSSTIFIGQSLLTNKYLFFALVIFYIGGILFAPKLLRKFF